MRVFIIAALTADGFIGKGTRHFSLDWTSKEDKHFFVEKTKQAGVVVFGQNTYETIGKPLKERLNIVYSRDKEYAAHLLDGRASTSETGREGVEVTQKDPKELLEDLGKRGYKEVAICGGATIYTMFMEAGVIDTMYLTIEPVLFGQGMALFNKALDKKLNLVNIEKLGEQSVLLEYNVLNP